MPLRYVSWGVLHTEKGLVVATPYNDVSTRYSPLIPTPQIVVLPIPRYLGHKVTHRQASVFRPSEDSLPKLTKSECLLFPKADVQTAGKSVK